MFLKRINAFLHQYCKHYLFQIKEPIFKILRVFKSEIFNLIIQKDT